MGDLRRDLDNFHRKLRWRAFFDQKDKDQPTPEPLSESLPYRDGKFKNPSGNEPPSGPTALEAFALVNELQLANCKGSNPSKQNLTREERKAISELKNNHNIVIKRADKGGATVILNKKDYIIEAVKQLSDTRFYKKLDTDPTHTYNSNIEGFLRDMCEKGEIHGDTLDYLLVEVPRTAQLYLLPKIHKGKQPPPGRPVVSANGCPTEKISEFVDSFVKPYVPIIKSYIKDTTDFLRKIRDIGRLPDNSIIATLDVTSLYTNIPNNEAIESVKKVLETHRRPTSNPKTDSLLKLLEMVLTMNNFQFNEENFLQVGGTAMGTRVAPSLANIFMADFEDKYVYTYHTQPHIWLRYIDDVFCVWTKGNEALDQFIEHLNNSHHSIKFTEERSTEKVSFLDTLVKLNDNSLITDLYTKPTDCHNYLRYESAHHPSCKKSLPYSQFLRVRRICENIESFDKHSQTMSEKLIEKGYPKKNVTEAIKKARDLDRPDLLKIKLPDVNTKEIPTVLVTTYQPNFGGLQEICKANWDLLKRSTATKELSEQRVIYGYRRPKNLKDLLVRAKLPTEKIQIEKPSTGPQNKCIRKNCRYCQKLDTSGKIISKTTGREYITKHNVSCKSNNLIYCITCKICNTQYVGQTKLRLMDRFQGHFWCIQTNTQKNDVAKHFNTPNHSGIEDVKIHILDFIHLGPYTDEGQYVRNHIEMNWVHRLRTQQPLGMNTLDTPPRYDPRLPKSWVHRRFP